MNTSPTNFFKAGGTLNPDAPSYVERSADDELLHLVLKGEFCYILTPRQMGKSSLMVRTVQRLKAQGSHTATIDLTGIGLVPIEKWYLGLLVELQRKLNLTADAEKWWIENTSLGPPQRFKNFLQDVVLAELTGRVVIFIDEIDSTLRLNFRDDFFAVIRAIYNDRAINPAFERLTFVLLGVATPTDLIQDRTRTPFNIGQRIDLREFSRADAQVLQSGLQAAHPEQAEVIFDRIFYWTNGHPYLTQTLCAKIVQDKTNTWNDERVDQIVEKTFLAEEARGESNLKFVNDVIKDHPQNRPLLTLYRQVYEGKTIPEDERSLIQNQLKLFGLVQGEKGALQVRNQIYRQAFNQTWIRQNMQVDWSRRIATAAVLVIFLLLSGFYYFYVRTGEQTNEALAQTYEQNFQETTNPTLRLGSLANLFGLPGFEPRGRVLFNTLSPEEQIALFTTDTTGLEEQVRTVIRGVYITLENTEANNQLLAAMEIALGRSDDAESKLLANEVARWLDGRYAFAQNDLEAAITYYNSAIDLNGQNSAVYFDRGLTFASQTSYAAALSDFNEGLSLHTDEDVLAQWRETISETIVANPRLHAAWWQQRQNYQRLTALLPTPTNTPTLTPTFFPTNTIAATLTSTTTKTSTPTPTNTPTVTSTSTPLRTQTPEVIFSPSPTLSSSEVYNPEYASISIHWPATSRTTINLDSVSEFSVGFDPKFCVGVWNLPDFNKLHINGALYIALRILHNGIEIENITVLTSNLITTSDNEGCHEQVFSEPGTYTALGYFCISAYYDCLNGLGWESSLPVTFEIYES